MKQKLHIYPLNKPYRIENCVNKNILNVYIRYRTRPASPLRFTFDDNLVDDTSGKLLPNKLTVDNLTIDWLRSRLNELDTSLKTTQLSRQAPQSPQDTNCDSK